MIKFLRKGHVQKKIFIVVAIAVITTFVIWGVKVGDEKSVPTTLGSIDTQKISLQDYLNSYKAVQHEMLLMYGERFEEIQGFMNLKGEAWDRLLLLNYAKKNDIKTSDQEVVDWVAAQPVFWTNGKFDNDTYRRYVASFMGNASKDLSISTRDFEEEIRQFLTLDKIRASIRSKHSVADEELKTLYNQEFGQRDLAYGFLASEAVQKDVVIEDQEVEKLLPLFKGQFKNSKEGAAPSESEIKEKIKGLMMGQKAIDLAVKKLEELKVKTPGASLEQILKDSGVEYQALNKFDKNNPIPVASDSPKALMTIAELKEGQISEALSLKDGAILIQVLKDYPADEKKFEEEKEKYKQTLINRKASNEFSRLLEDLRSKLNVNLDVMKKIFPSNDETQ